MNGNVTLMQKLVETVRHKYGLKTEKQAYTKIEYLIENAEPELKVSKAFHKKLDKIQAEMEKGDWLPLSSLAKA